MLNSIKQKINSFFRRNTDVSPTVVRRLSLSLNFPNDAADLMIFWLTLPQNKEAVLDTFARYGINRRSHRAPSKFEMTAFYEALRYAKPVDARSGLKIVRQLPQG